ncbi:hypothetical protein VitviT2T_004890 [Vitis vinifera]|uniref:Uncharacterized protein n=1 Tax=Vitis vinifera TaxID=29760 RepID=A0ABY9BR58_VITVI|nr:hypothetical protein VitviT2T_004890 [Vitis vinifera]
MRNLSIIHHATNQVEMILKGPGCCNDMSRSMPSGFSAKDLFLDQAKVWRPTESMTCSRLLGGFCIKDHFQEIALWEVSSKQKVASRAFGLWDMRGTSMKLKVTLTKEPRISVTCVQWCPGGSRFGSSWMDVHGTVGPSSSVSLGSDASLLYMELSLPYMMNQ